MAIERGREGFPLRLRIPECHLSEVDAPLVRLGAGN
jgi:hypothetical protein